MLGLTFLKNGGDNLSFGRVSAFLIVFTALIIISASVADVNGDPAKINWEGMGSFLLNSGFVSMLFYGGSKGLDILKIVAQGMYGIKPPNKPLPIKPTE